MGELIQAAGKRRKKAPVEGVEGADYRRKYAMAVGALMAPLMERGVGKSGSMLAQIVPHWGAICPLLAKHSFPESLKGDVLTVAVASDAVKQELHYVAPQVIEGVNLLLGYAAVSKVRAMTRHGIGVNAGKTAQKAKEAPSVAVDDRLKELCKSIRDDELRAAMVKLGAQVSNKNGGKKS